MAITAEQLAAALREAEAAHAEYERGSAVQIRIGRPGTRTTSSSSCTSRAGSVSTPRTCVLEAAMRLHGRLGRPGGRAPPGEGAERCARPRCLIGNQRADHRPTI